MSDWGSYVLAFRALAEATEGRVERTDVLRRLVRIGAPEEALDALGDPLPTDRSPPTTFGPRLAFDLVRAAPPEADFDPTELATLAGLSEDQVLSLYALAEAAASRDRLAKALFPPGGVPISHRANRGTSADGSPRWVTYLKILLLVSAADGLDPAEEAWILDHVATTWGVPCELLHAARSAMGWSDKGTEDWDEVVAGFADTPRDFRLALLYDTVLAACADGHYSSEERATARRLATSLELQGALPAVEAAAAVSRLADQLSSDLFGAGHGLPARLPLADDDEEDDEHDDFTDELDA